MAGGGKSSGAQTATQTNEPWSKIQPFLLGGTERKLRAGVAPTFTTSQVWQPGGGGSEGGGGGSWATQQTQNNPDSDYETITTPGVLQGAADLYGRSGWSPAMGANNKAALGLLGGQQTQLAGRAGQDLSYRDLSGDLMAGRNYDPFVSTLSAVGPNGVNAQAARASQGPLDPTAALQSLLSGRVQNPYLDQQVANLTQRLTDNTTMNVLPGIRAGATAAGQYGGNRQGIAEGLAASRLNSDISSAAMPIYGSAFENAQQRQYGTATGLNQQAVDIATGNANRDFAAQQFNVGTQLNNVNMINAARQQMLNNRLQGLNVQQQGNAAQDATTAAQFQNYGQTQSLLGQPTDYDWQNLARYNQILQPYAGMGGTSTTSQPTSSNPLAGILGLGLGGAQIYSLLSDRRAKTDIERVGTMASGMPIYRYRYFGEGPFHMGVMADEAKQVRPDAVTTGADGFDRVDYGRL